MPSPRYLTLAAAMIAIAPATAWADAPCPGGDPARFPDSPPMPTITSYTVTRSTAPVGERESGVHEATVIGGDPVEGSLRIDMRLSADLPRNCPLSVQIIDPAVSETEQREGGGDVARVFSITAADRVQTFALNNSDRSYHSFILSSDGSNRLALTVRTRGQFGDHTANLGLRIRSTGPVYPFAITRRGVPDYTATLSANATRFGSTVDVVAALPFNPAPGMIDETVTFAVKPAKAGNFRRPNQLNTLEPVLTEPLDADFNPRRATMIFVPSATEKPVTAAITTTLMGRIKSLPITIRPVPKPCQPAAAWTIGKGEVELTLTNTGELPCPELRVTLTAPGMTIPRNTATSWPILPSPEAPAATPGPRSLTMSPPPPPLDPNAPTRWSGAFGITGPYPAAGFAITATLRPLDGTFPTITLPSFTVDRLTISKGR